MKKSTQLLMGLLLLAGLTFPSCQEAPKKEETASVPAPESTQPAIDPALDPMKVEAPLMTNKFGDTLGIQMYEVAIKPGDTVLLHAHPDYTLYVAEGGTIRITPKDGEAQVVEFKTGSGMISPAGIHAGKNIGTTTIRLVATNIYRARP
jgi:quercetin dioxygenase-like cupin family protein